MQTMAEPGGKREGSYREKRTFAQTAKTQMDINTYPDQVIEQTVDHAAVEASAAGQARQLAIGIVEGVGPDMKDHAGNVRA